MANDYYHCYDDPNGNAVAGNAFQRTVRNLANNGTENKSFYSLTADMALLHTDAATKNIRPVNTATLGQSAGGRELRVIVLGPNNVPKILICGCHHAREWISVEVPYILGRYLVDTYPVNLQLSQMTHEQRRVKYLVDNRQIWIVPMVNPDGHERSLVTDRNWRKNARTLTLNNPLTITRHWETVQLTRYWPDDDWKGNNQATALQIFGNHSIHQNTGNYSRIVANCNATVTITATQNATWGTASTGTCTAGHTVTQSVTNAGNYNGVDINRNYASNDWGTEHGLGGICHVRAEPWHDSCFGPGAASEAETLLMQGIVTNQQFSGIITYHNFSELILYSDRLPANAGAATNWAVELAARMADLVALSRGHHYTPCFASAIYKTTGDICDYAFDQTALRRAYTIELPPKYSLAGTSGFSRLNANQIDPIFLENLPAALALINCAPHTAPPGQVLHNMPQNVTAQATVQVTQNCWKVFNNWPNPPT